MPVRLECFPVAVPDGYTPPEPTYIVAEGEGGARERRRCPEEIRFHDGFLDDRNLRLPGIQRHNGIDIAGGVGLHIVATTHGTVLRTWRFFSGVTVPGAGWTVPGGNYVVIVDMSGYVHYYAHMHETPRVNPTDVVRAGQHIGLLGRTGSAAGSGSCPHLHYQIYRPMRALEGLDLEGRFFLPENPYSELRRVQALPRP